MAQRFAQDPVRIIGAGPAGLACAIILRRAGREVVVHEAHPMVGRRFHGDFQGIENWSDATDALIELATAGIDLGGLPVAVREGRVIAPDGRQWPVASERPLYYLVRRGHQPGSLDQALLAQALSLGVEVRAGERRQRSDGPSVLAGGPRRADAIAVGYVFETEMADANWLAVAASVAPLGYAYLLVHQGRGTLATCLFTDFKREADYLERAVALFTEQAGLAMRAPRRFGGYVNFRIPRTAVQGGNPVLGEHAGFQDALAGFGLRYAFRSGILAARAILGGEDYEAAWRRRLLPLLRAGTVNRLLFNALGEWGRTRALRRLGQGDAGQTLRRAYNPRLGTRLLFPLARLLYRRPLRDPSCNHIDCSCVWCTHGERAALATACSS